jgi:hypothetical protein
MVLHTRPQPAFLPCGARFLKPAFGNKTEREGERGEREKKKTEGKREEKGRRGASKQHP